MAEEDAENEKKDEKKDKEKEEKNFENFFHFLAMTLPVRKFFCRWFRIDDSEITVAQHIMTSGKAYLERKIPKGKRGVRILHVPSETIKRMQKAILENLLLAIPVHFAAYGSRLGSSSKACAQVHSGFAKSIYNLDLKHAFPSVPRHRVIAHLRFPIKDHVRQFGVELTEEQVQELLEVIVDVIVYNDAIPQGSPASPALLNIVCMKLDQEITLYLLGLEKEKGKEFRYSRYVDDITISSNDTMDGKIQKGIKRLIKECGFRPHPDKEHYVDNIEGQKAEVVGILVHPDGALSLSSKKINRMRARLWKLIGEEDPKNYQEIQGIIAYIQHVYSGKPPAKVRQLIAQAVQKLGGREEHG